jgi:acyl-CoA thioester hydrolase
VSEFWWPVRVYYEDTDSGGVVYHASYLRYMERARTEWLRALGVEQDVLRRDHGVIFAVYSLRLDFLRPAVFNDSLHVSAVPTEWGRASLVFEQRIRRAEETLCQGVVKVACLDAASFRPRPIPRVISAEIHGDD